MTARRRSQQLSQSERYLFEIVIVLVVLTLLVNATANPMCLNGCNADFWGVVLINGVLATCMLFTIAVLLSTRRIRKKARRRPSPR
jgi:hypothetical protein